MVSYTWQPSRQLFQKSYNAAALLSTLYGGLSRLVRCLIPLHCQPSPALHSVSARHRDISQSISDVCFIQSSWYCGLLAKWLGPTESHASQPRTETSEGDSDHDNHFKVQEVRMTCQICQSNQNASDQQHKGALSAQWQALTARRCT